MYQQPSESLHWPELLAALRSCAGNLVHLRVGNTTDPAGSVRIRSAARGTEYCLFEGTEPTTRVALIEQLETFAKSPDRRFMAAARVHVGGAYYLVEHLVDEESNGVVNTTILARRSKGGFEPMRGSAPPTGRSKRIKTT
ncbi:MAG: hypothetical protein ACYDA5_04810 [Vulcanimicrobiaceae bacterium]